ncbi:hypothetical protein GCM10009577_07300 [Streptomyces javensis]
MGREASRHADDQQDEYRDDDADAQGVEPVPAAELLPPVHRDSVLGPLVAELAATMREAVANGPRGRAAVAALTDAYVDFAERNPALYDAMFLLDTGLPFADEATPAPLREAFETLVDTLGDIAGPADPALFEIFWSALHGLVSLTRSGRLPRQEASRRLGVLVDRFAERGGDG